MNPTKHYVLVFIFFFSICANASYPKETSADFKLFLSELKEIAKSKDFHKFKNLTSSKFTIGEELDLKASLSVIKKNPDKFKSLLAIADHEACYRTGSNLVQCQYPDPGPDLDNTETMKSALLIAERIRKKWKINVFSALEGKY